MGKPPPKKCRIKINLILKYLEIYQRCLFKVNGFIDFLTLPICSTLGVGCEDASEKLELATKTDDLGSLGVNRDPSELLATSSKVSSSFDESDGAGATTRGSIRLFRRFFSGTGSGISDGIGGTFPGHVSR